MGRKRFEEHSYDGDGASGAHGVKWNAVALVGRQGTILIFSVLLARLLGPTSYGVVAQATIYTSFVALLLDQGLTAALISRKTVSAKEVGAAASVNLVLAAALGAVTFLVSGIIAAFFATNELEAVLNVMGMALILKGGAIVPRMLLMRTLHFKAIAISDVVASFVGGLAGVVAALGGLSYWSLVIQIVTTDLVAMVLLLAMARAPLPNLHFPAVAAHLAFSSRVFVGNLVSFSSRNVDNILIGRFFGADALAQYSLAYRVLLTPVQMVGQVVTRVLFPAVARSRERLTEVGDLIIRSTRSIALVSFPGMALIAVSAPDTVPLFLGVAWLPAVAVLQVLAVTGARQAVTAVNAPVLLGLNLSKQHLRFNLVAAVVQIAGMVAGLPWGILGVAVGYTIAGFVLMPLIIGLQVRFAKLSVRRQIGALVPAAAGALLAIVPYLALYFTDLPSVLRLTVGAVSGALVYFVYLRLAHRSTWKLAVADVRLIVGKPRG